MLYFAVYCLSLLRFRWSEQNGTELSWFFFSLSVKTSNTSFSSNRLKSSVLSKVVVPHGLWCSHHLGAPWYCNHITVVPLLPSVVYRNCKQRGICDLVFWILRDTALLTLKKIAFLVTSLWGSVAGSMAALQVGISQPRRTVRSHSRNISHISKPFPIIRGLSHRVTVSFKIHV